VFTVIVATVVIYGSTAALAARLTHVARAEPHGLVLIGAQQWVRELAGELTNLEVPVLLITSDNREARLARRDSLLVFNGRTDSEELDDVIEAIGIRDAVILSTNPELNVVAQERLAALLSRKHIYELQDDEAVTEPGVVGAVIARRAFGSRLSHQVVERAFKDGDRILTVGSDEIEPDSTVLMTVGADRGVNVVPDQRHIDSALAVLVLASPSPRAN